MTKKDLFTAAHKIAHDTKEIAGSYRIAFACALKKLYKDINKMDELTTAQKLENLGVTAWEKGEMKRYYINDSMFEKVFTLAIKRYKSGNIFSATLGGDVISNSHAGRLIGCKKFYYDAVSGQWYEKRGMEAPCELCEELKVHLTV